MRSQAEVNKVLREYRRENSRKHAAWLKKQPPEKLKAIKAAKNRGMQKMRAERKKKNLCVAHGFTKPCKYCVNLDLFRYLPEEEKQKILDARRKRRNYRNALWRDKQSPEWQAEHRRRLLQFVKDYREGKYVHKTMVAEEARLQKRQERVLAKGVVPTPATGESVVLPQAGMADLQKNEGVRAPVRVEVRVGRGVSPKDSKAPRQQETQGKVPRISGKEQEESVQTKAG